MADGEGDDLTDDERRALHELIDYLDAFPVRPIVTSAGVLLTRAAEKLQSVLH